MKRKTLLIIGAVGLFVVGLLIAASFVMLPRFMAAQSSGMHRGPGMMGGGNTGSSELVAVAADGTALPVDPASEALEGTAMQKVGDLTVALTLAPYPPVSFGPAKFNVFLTDENGQPVSDATVSLDMTMPSMRMPDNQPAASYIENGLYQADGRFTMRGGWRIEVIIVRGAETLSAFFDIGL